MLGQSSYFLLTARSMLCFKRHYNVPLPAQEEYCREKGAICGYVEKRLAMSNWEKRLAVITRDNNLVIYKYYLLDICPGEPLMGKIYELEKIKVMHIERFPDGEIISRIRTLDGKSVKLRLKGKDASAWAAKLIKRTPGDRSAAMVGNVPGVVVTGSDSNNNMIYNNNNTSEERASGGKTKDDMNFSDLVHTILTSSSRSDRNAVRDQLDELIKRHLQNDTDRLLTDLSPSARADAAAVRLSKVIVNRYKMITLIVSTAYVLTTKSKLDSAVSEAARPSIVPHQRVASDLVFVRVLNICKFLADTFRRGPVNRI
ncbi:unnamed protein product [Heligmosomoides polygyrus]|uniref:PH_15 domain-containing protein n=1 Tax=Heligmosomoides polygyrus TaxID=6339 RepID=A0A3P8C5A6_HELPZ|nr:unnamed protein product [Heligmosomoides polygyrus]